MAQNDHLLENLCREPETLTEAQSILRLAKVKTAPGSGFVLGAYSTGLPAISAYIASQRYDLPAFVSQYVLKMCHSLNNNDVTRQAAQIASCLKATDFDKAFHLIEAAIGGTRRRTNTKLTYDYFFAKYKMLMPRQRLLVWANQAENALLQLDHKLDRESNEVKGAIFVWIFNVIEVRQSVLFPTRSL